MDLSKYATLFLAESREHLKACNSSLLEWEKEPAAAEPVDRLFRAIHTIKGMAATMGYSAVAQLAHGIENLLDGLRQGRLQGSSGVFQLLFRAIDTLGKSVESAAASAAEEPPDTALLADLEQAAQADQPAKPPEAAPEAPVPARRITDAPSPSTDPGGHSSWCSDAGRAGRAGTAASGDPGDGEHDTASSNRTGEGRF